MSLPKTIGNFTDNRTEKQKKIEIIVLVRKEKRKVARIRSRAARLEPPDRRFAPRLQSDSDRRRVRKCRFECRPFALIFTIRSRSTVKNRRVKSCFIEFQPIEEISKEKCQFEHSYLNKISLFNFFQIFASNLSRCICRSFRYIYGYLEEKLINIIPSSPGTSSTKTCIACPAISGCSAYAFFEISIPKYRDKYIDYTDKLYPSKIQTDRSRSAIGCLCIVSASCERHKPVYSGIDNEWLGSGSLKKMHYFIMHRIPGTSLRAITNTPSI
ncbi:unnamed protein product [Nesidiocoris tenuis]|uniref:Uncharacterized protein n=1 Tax=Nesidiocoris tenuis TaxID=355587 RepID=A0A6H5HQF1_9HEMI|nr:unnamed protein product [Nesidiocoris tenuis]